MRTLTEQRISRAYGQLFIVFFGMFFLSVPAGFLFFEKLAEPFSGSPVFFGAFFIGLVLVHVFAVIIAIAHLKSIKEWKRLAENAYKAGRAALGNALPNSPIELMMSDTRSFRLSRTATDSLLIEMDSRSQRPRQYKLYKDDIEEVSPPREDTYTLDVPKMTAAMLDYGKRRSTQRSRSD